jgi:hypothetical protein
MALDEDRVESDVANMQVAYDNAMKLMEKYLTDDTISVPALYAVVNTLVDKTLDASPAITVAGMLNESVKHALVMAVTQAFFTGTEWGKRPFYEVPAHEACTDPTHDHHISRLN